MDNSCVFIKFWSKEKNIELTEENTVDDQIDGDQFNGFDQINGQKGYDNHLCAVNNGFLTNYLTDLTFGWRNLVFFLKNPRVWSINGSDKEDDYNKFIMNKGLIQYLLRVVEKLKF